MAGEKIETLNFAIRNSIPAMREAANENPNAQILVRAVRFGSGAQWHVSQPTPVDSFTWMDIEADGETRMGEALKLTAEQLKMPPMDSRALPPVLVLLSDGQPTDDFSAGLKALMDLPWGKKSVRIAIAIGHDADIDTLQKFIGNREVQPLRANNADALIRYIKWASTMVVKEVSQPSSQTDGQGEHQAVPIPIPASNGDSGNADPNIW